MKGLNIFLKDFKFIFRERGRERERRRETLMFKRNINWLPLTHPQLGIWPATQAHVLTGQVLNPLSTPARAEAVKIVKSDKHTGSALFYLSVAPIMYGAEL